MRLDQDQQVPPGVDVAVEVMGNLPLQMKVEDLIRRLGRRQSRPSFNRVYPPTILELITLVKRNPARPRDKAWDSIMALNMQYDEATRMVSVTYCLEHCGLDRRTGEYHPRRRTVTYSAPVEEVTAKTDRKLRRLEKYADR